jgi:hypothetical protein
MAVKRHYCNEAGKALKLQIVMDCTNQIVHVDRSDKMANSFLLWHDPCCVIKC